MSVLGGGRPVSLDQLAALNDEMAALVRAGVPLEVGLCDMGRDLPGRLGRIAEQLSQRMQTGESLEQVLTADEGSFPPVWRSVVLAGLRSGQLGAALEGLSATARRISEQRRIVSLALIYPLTVAALAYLFFVFLVLYAPVGDQAVVDLTGASDPFLAAMAWLGRRAGWILLAIPLAAALLLGVVWWRTGRANLSSSQAADRRSTFFGGRWPTLRQAVRDGRLATFSEILALLVRRQVPLQESLVLAAEASGDRGLGRAAGEVAARLEAGQALNGAEAIRPPLPRLLGWLLSSGVSSDELSWALTQAAEGYRQRARRAAAWSAIYLPDVLTVVVGGTATLLLALAVVTPVWRLLYALSQG